MWQGAARRWQCAQHTLWTNPLAPAVELSKAVELHTAGQRPGCNYASPVAPVAVAAAAARQSRQ